MTTLKLATTSVRKDRDGNQQEKTQWHRVKLFGKLAEVAGEYLKKGRQVYIEGSINYDEFVGSDGNKKYVTEILADEMQMLGGGASGGGEGERSSGGYSRQQGGGTRPQGGGRQQSQGQGYVADFGDNADGPDPDIPF